VLITGLAIEIYIFQCALSAVEQYDTVSTDMRTDPASAPGYAIYEGFIADMFNRFFFGAASECSGK
jgi:hypothetical protein